MARYLREYRRDIRMQHEIGVLDKGALTPTEIDRAGGIVEVNIKDITPFSVLDRIGYRRTVALETMRG